MRSTPPQRKPHVLRCIAMVLRSDWVTMTAEAIAGWTSSTSVACIIANLKSVGGGNDQFADCAGAERSGCRRR